MHTPILIKYQLKIFLISSQVQNLDQRMNSNKKSLNKEEINKIKTEFKSIINKL